MKSKLEWFGDPASHASNSRLGEKLRKSNDLNDNRNNKTNSNRSNDSNNSKRSSGNDDSNHLNLQSFNFQEKLLTMRTWTADPD